MIYNAHPIYTLIGNILLKCIGSMHELGVRCWGYVIFVGEILHACMHV